MTTDIERGGIDVSGTHEPSYYEIALTNRQVVVAFVILLTCVVAAFFSGVWIGRESAARAQERLALLGRGTVLDGGAAGAPGSPGSPGSSTATDKGKPEGQALQEFKFFADPHHRPDAGAKAGTGAAGTAGAKGTRAVPATAAGGDEDDSPASAAPAPSKSTTTSASATPALQVPERRAAGRGDGGPAGRSTLAGDLSHRGGNSAARAQAGTASEAPADATAASAPITAAKRTRRDSATPPGQATSGASSAGAAAASGAVGDLVIQVFSTADREQADKVRGGLVDAGFTAFLSPIAKGGQTMYRVRIGPFPSRSAAETVADKVRKERKLDTWITPK
jgi:cell division septation protein DedD